MFQPLAGVRVVDLSQVLAGPYATYLLALMGAEVLKIEKPGEGDWTRIGQGIPKLTEQRMGLSYLVQNADKKSVAVDLKTPEGIEIVKRLVATSDVFLENFKPGVAERLGLGYDALKAVNPKLAYVSISAFGQDGPMSPRPAYDHVIQGMCGIMLTTGAPGAGPTKVGSPYVDYATGMNAAMATLGAIMEVRRTGQAVRIDVAMLDTALMLMASLVTNVLSSDWKPVQTGNEAWSQSPSSGAFQTSDGVLMLAANNESQFRRLCPAIGRSDILSDPRWSDPEIRKSNFPALRETLIETFKNRSATEWEEILSCVQVPAGRVRGLEEILAEPQIAARGLTGAIHVEGHDAPVMVPAMGFKADGSSNAPKSPPPQLGADTEAVLRVAGFDDLDLIRFRDARAI